MNNIVTIESNILGLKHEFESVLTDRSISFAKEAEFALQTLRASEYMTQAALNTPSSLRNAIINVAAIGISLNPAQKQAYLVPRKAKIKQDGQSVERVIICLDISYMGLVQLALQSGDLRMVVADVVYEGEQFIMHGIDKEPTHERDTFAPHEDRQIVGAYCTAKTAYGDFMTTTMSRKEIDDIRKTSESWKNEKSRPYSPWACHYPEMAKKTVIKRAAKLWPKSDRMARLDKAINLLNTENGEGLAKEEGTQIDIDVEISYLDTLNTADEIIAHWRKLSQRLPANSPARQPIIEAFAKRKQQIIAAANVQDVTPKEEPAEVLHD